ncbi:MAG: hypothetical protein M3R17_02265 [Bacteroidota bacterium]|nr:hypothetical protein [Bacteroidota bacterium]
MKKPAKYIFAACLFPLTISAQIFHWESPVDAVGADGYYRILLQPDVTAKLQTHFSDVRIYDQDNVETSYLIYKDEATQGVDRFVTYQIVDKHYSNGCCSHITVKNSLENPIDHIVLEVNNAQAKREMTLTASYDGEHFFALVDHFTVASFNTYNKGERKTTSLLRFDFPFTDYKYYRFNFDDWTWWWHNYNQPVFVVRAGYIEPTFIPEECLEIPQPLLLQTDSTKKKQSYIHISFADSQYVDHLRFKIAAKNKSGDYYRAASLYQIVETTTGGITKKEEVFISSTIVSSVNANEINLGRMRVKDLVLRIDNDDNQPLLVSSIRAFQVKHYLVADLEKKNNYFIRFGNDSIPAPVYDLAYFKDKIPAKPEVIKSGIRKDISEKRISTKAEDQAQLGDSIFKDKKIIWGAIGLVILLLGVMTMRMLKEMKTKENNE